MFGVVPGFSWGEIIADLLVALVLGVIAYGKRQLKRELSEPLKKTTKALRKHVKDDRGFQKQISNQIFELSGRVHQYEANAERYRRFGRAEHLRHDESDV